MLNLLLFIYSYSVTKFLNDIVLIVFYVKFYGNENVAFYVELKLYEPVHKCVVELRIKKIRRIKFKYLRISVNTLNKNIICFLKHYLPIEKVNPQPRIPE